MADGNGRKTGVDSRETAVPRVMGHPLGWRGNGHPLGSLSVWPLPGQKH